MLRSSSRRADLLVGHNVILNRKCLIAIARRSAASGRIDAISKAAVSRHKQNARFPSSLMIHRGRYLACAIRKQNTRRASSDKCIRACFLFAACARSRANVLVRPAKISRIFLLGINPGRNTGQRVRTENSLDKQPSRHLRPLPFSFPP